MRLTCWTRSAVRTSRSRLIRRRSSSCGAGALTIAHTRASPRWGASRARPRASPSILSVFARRRRREVAIEAGSTTWLSIPSLCRTRWIQNPSSPASWMTMMGRTRPVRARAFSLSWDKRARRAAMSPLRTECFDIFSPPPGARDVMTQVERLSPRDTSRVEIGADSGVFVRSRTEGLHGRSRVGGSAPALCQRAGCYQSRPWDLQGPPLRGHADPASRLLVPALPTQLPRHRGAVPRARPGGGPLHPEPVGSGLRAPDRAPAADLPQATLRVNPRRRDIHQDPRPVALPVPGHRQARKPSRPPRLATPAVGPLRHLVLQLRFILTAHMGAILSISRNGFIERPP